MTQVAPGKLFLLLGSSARNASLSLSMTPWQNLIKPCAVSSENRVVRELTLNSAEIQERHPIFPKLR